MPINHFPLLLGDIGGTNARFALQDADGSIRDIEVLPTVDYETIGMATEAYLVRVGMDAVSRRPKHGAFGIANPITGDYIRMTNHSWAFSIEALKNELKLDTLLFLNDFTALALSLPHLPAADLKQVGGGEREPNAAIALLGAGTGLGVSGLLPDGRGGWIAVAGEGGHVTLLAETAREWQLIEAVQAEYPHVSAERFLCGSGFTLAYETLARLDGLTPETLTPADVAQRGVAGTCAICREVVDLFCGWFGAVSGNLALTLGATGGVFIGGGIIPKMGDYFVNSTFRNRFEAKGRFSVFLAPIPVFIIESPYPAFIGAGAALVAHLNR